MKTRLLLLISCLLITGAAQAQTWVAIGDSLAFGYQQAKFLNLFLSGQYDPAAFNTGFVDVITSFAQSSQPNFKTANFSCPGETTTSLVVGGCPLHNWVFALPLHEDYPGSTPQIFAAVQYLQAHPGEVVLITVTIGGNDLLNLLSNCAGDATCVQQGLPGVTTQASNTLANVIFYLRTISPQSVVLYTNVPDPYAFSDPTTVAIFSSFNSAMGAAATKAGGRVVDWFGQEQQFDQNTLCLLSYVCQAPLYDIHPTDFGYQILAVWTVQALQ